MPLTSTVDLSVAALYTKILDLQSASAPVQAKFTVSLAEGTGANQANRVFADRRTLAASATENLDLAGVLLDAFGDTIALARVKVLIVRASAANTNNVIVGGAGSNGFVGPFGAAAHTASVRPGGMVAFACADATGWPVTAGTADLLQIANSGAGTSVEYEVIIIGATA
ncbi:hypothetical protein [Elioraea sp.]|uniref:hypothetical protein n=1 Tax=Elioraea sp. TaxID=2185103 RepID=UPI0025BABCFB|nr:hypothetical protein [Elioraea sp.]